jgi:hypothetical protein
MFYIAYFTCARHFAYLRLSLQSWHHIGDYSYINSITVHVDYSDPLDEAQISILQNISLVSITFLLTAERMAHVGLHVVNNEITGFVDLSRHAKPTDWIIKIDSDVLVTSALVGFDYVLQKSHGAMIGYPCSSYIQGGVYFLRARDIYRLLSVPLDQNRYVRRSVNKCSEDASITEQMRMGGGLIERLSSLVWNRPMIGDLQITPCRCSFLHFSGHAKSRMKQAFDIVSSHVSKAT